jgi:hypothetical protein
MEEDDDDDEPLYDLHGPRGICSRYNGRLITRDVLQEKPFQRARDCDILAVESAWKSQLASSCDLRWVEAHVLSGSILNTWAVVGSAMGHSSSPARAGMPRKIPLVRAQLTGGGAMVGVRIRPETLEGVRYALNAMLKQATDHRAGSSSTSAELSSARAAPASAASAAKRPSDTLAVQDLSERLEECLKRISQDELAGRGWSAAHELLADAGLVDGGTEGMHAAQEAVADLQRNGKVEIDKNTGALTLLKKQRGNGWYIPPPKKPKTTGRGRSGRGRGRGRGGRGKQVAPVVEDDRPWSPPDEPWSDSSDELRNR